MAATEEVSATEEVVEPGYDFGESMQQQIVALLLRDARFAERSTDLIKPEYFDNAALGALAQVGIEYFRTYKEVPGKEIGHALKRAIDAKRIRPDMAADLKDQIRTVYSTTISAPKMILEEVSNFARNKAVENAILKSAELVAKGEYPRIEKLMREALLVGAAQQTTSYDYWAEVEHRTTYRKDLLSGAIVRNGITTGCADFDKLLYHHGWGRKELAVMMGPPKGGKSMSLADFGKSASLAGKNVIYFSCEVSAKIIADRLDANIADVVMNMVGTSPSKVDAAVKAAHARAGHFIIEEYPSGVLKCSEMRRVLERHRSNGIVFDLIISDYGDIMAPEYRADDQRENLRTIFVDLRAIAFEYDAAVLTATQTNRDGAKAAVAKMTDVAEDFNKIRTADVIISINSTEAERLAGECRLFFAASRNTEDGFVLRIKSDRQRMQFLKSVMGRE